MFVRIPARRGLFGLCLALWTFVFAPSAQASYAYYVGRNLTANGAVMIGGTGEEVSSHWLEIIPARDHPDGAMIKVGVTGDATIPGELIEIPQVAHTFRYMQMSYTDFEGFPPPLTNGGVNEHQVAVRDVWAPSRDELVAMTPPPQRGLQYSDLARIVMERATTAREGVEIIGALIAEHGLGAYIAVPGLSGAITRPRPRRMTMPARLRSGAISGWPWRSSPSWCLSPQRR